MVLFEDGAALVGILIAASGIFLSNLLDRPELDGAASLLIGLVLARVATILTRESKSLLIGERAAPLLVASAVKLAQEEPGVASAHGAVTIHLAPEQILVALSVEFQDQMTTPEIETTVERIEERIRARYPEIVTLFIKPQTCERFTAWKLDRFGFVDST